MPYKVAADFVLLVHFLWIVFLICGALIGGKVRTVKILHIAALGFAVMMQIFGCYCPLTHLEFWLRQRHDPALAYSGSFIVHYVEQIIYIELSPVIIFVLTLILVATSVYIYTKRKEK